MADNALRYRDGPKQFMGVPSYFDWEDVGDAAAGVGNALYELARSPLTASEGLLNAIGSGDRWAPGLALLDYLANVPGPSESLLAKLGPLTLKGVNALADVMTQGMLIGPKSALWKKLPQVGGYLEDVGEGVLKVGGEGDLPSFLHRISGTNITTNRGYRMAHARGMWKNPESYVGPGKDEPRRMFHITRTPGFDEFNTIGSRQLGSHFGTETQVGGIYNSQKSLGGPKGEGVYPVYLDIKNPLRMKDLEDFSAGRVAKEAHKMGVFDDSEYKRITEVLSNYAKSKNAGIYSDEQYNKLANEWVIGGLELKGYDGIVYLNRKEMAMREGGNPAEWVRKYRPDLSGQRTSPSEQSSLYKFMDEADDKWWYEHIPSDDSVVAFRPNQIVSSIGIKRGQTYPQGAFSNLYDRTTAVEIPDDAAKFTNLIRDEGRGAQEGIGPISSLIEHQQLYEAYPELGDVRASIYSKEGTPLAGSFASSENYPGGYLPQIKAEGPSLRSARKSTLHELQHAVQEREGWARGGSVAAMAVPRDQALARINFLNSELSRLAKEMDAVKLGSSQYDALRTEYDAAMAEKFRIWDESTKDPMKQYQNLLGEIMARDTAARMALTGEQRYTNALAHPLAGQGGLAPDARWSVLSTENIPLEDAIVRMQGGGPSLMTAWHGSPHKWDKVDLSKAGTGEGGAAYGHGFYATDLEEIADYYKSSLAKYPVDDVLKEIIPERKYFDPAELGEFYRAARDAEFTGKSLWNRNRTLRDIPPENLQLAIDEIRKRGRGHLYKLDIPESHMLLDWDKPLSEQPEGVRKALDKAGAMRKAGYSLSVHESNNHGSSLYDALARKFGKERTFGPQNKPDLQWTDVVPDYQAASEYLRSIGIPGHRYLDQGSRGAGEGTYNYVIYDPELIKVLEMSKNQNALAKNGAFA